jgi:hypothetical protein
MSGKYLFPAIQAYHVSILIFDIPKIRDNILNFKSGIDQKYFGHQGNDRRKTG